MEMEKISESIQKYGNKITDLQKATVNLGTSAKTYV